MNTSSKHTVHRDFIDFLLLLYSHSKIFYMTLFSLLLLAVLFNFMQTPKYKFSVEIRAPSSNDLFMPVIMYRDNLRNASDEATLNKGKEFSSLGVDKILFDLLIGGRIFPIIDNKISESSSTDSNVRTVINAKRKDIHFVVDIKSPDKFLVKSIHENIMPLMQQEISRIYKNIVADHKTNALNKIQSLLKSDTASQLRKVSAELLKSEYAKVQSSEVLIDNNSINEQYTEELKENAVYSEYSEKFDFIDNLEIPDLDLAYIYFVQTDLDKDSEIPSSFVYIFAVFLSIFLFILIVIMLDLRNQVFLRRGSDN